jgi:predicted 2-oxoglutarate/Fe(II)-dependent dioxygenase YbiX
VTGVRVDVDRRLDLDPLVGSLLTAGRADLARTLVEDAVSRRPEDVETLALAALLDRRDGDLERAADRYAAVAQLDPAHPYAADLAVMLRPVTAADLLVGAAPANLPAVPVRMTAASSRGGGPVPVAVVDGALSGERVRQLQALAADPAARLKPGRVNYEVRPDVRSNLNVRSPEIGAALDGWFAERVRALVGPVCDHLGRPRFPLTGQEQRLNAYGDGAYFRLHRDDSGGEDALPRVLSYVCFLHAEPRSFTGGDLLLHDEQSGSAFWEQRFTRITPAVNRMVWFPSAAYHQATTVRTSTDPCRARLLVNGHVWSG